MCVYVWCGFSIISLFLPYVTSSKVFDVKALRAFRVLRPLKLVSGVPSKRCVDYSAVMCAMIAGILSQNWQPLDSDKTDTSLHCVLCNCILYNKHNKKTTYNDSKTSRTTLRDGHGLGPPMGWVGLGWVQTSKCKTWSTLASTSTFTLPPPPM